MKIVVPETSHGYKPFNVNITIETAVEAFEIMKFCQESTPLRDEFAWKLGKAVEKGVMA